jgi:hypothetical protein
MAQHTSQCPAKGCGKPLQEVSTGVGDQPSTRSAMDVVDAPGGNERFAACEDGHCWRLRGPLGWEPDAERTAARLMGRPLG